MSKSISELAHIKQLLGCVVKQVTLLEYSGWGYDGLTLMQHKLLEVHYFKVPEF